MSTEPKTLFAGTDIDSILKTAFAHLPETPTMTAEEYHQNERRLIFKKDADPEFTQPIDRSQLTDPEAFDRIAKWDGKFPGILAHGPTGTSKTRAAWYALGRIYILEGKSIKPFTAKALTSDYERYEQTNSTSYFLNRLEDYSVLFVDDLEKINWQFQSNVAALWDFFDWVYRKKRPCLVTTNKPREWWVEKMDEAFARRLFQCEVEFRDR